MAYPEHWGKRERRRARGGLRRMTPDDRAGARKVCDFGDSLALYTYAGYAWLGSTKSSHYVSIWDPISTGGPYLDHVMHFLTAHERLAMRAALAREVA